MGANDLKRADLPDLFAGGAIGLIGYAVGLSRGITGLIAVASFLGSIALRRLWQARKDSRA